MKNKVYVWDPLVRIFHWVLLLAFVTSYITGENEIDFHPYSGFLILGLITFRVLWGFIGSKHARFSDFIRPLPETIDYLKSLFGSGGSEKHFVGHNPAGGLMILALLLSLFFTGFSGLKLYGIDGHGPFAIAHVQDKAGRDEASYAKKVESYDEHESDEHDEAYKDEEAEEFWEEIHEFFVSFTLMLVILHVAGVILSSRKHNENLVRAMVTGYKEQQDSLEDSSDTLEK